MVSGETTASTTNATWARDSGQARNGTYGYKHTKTVAAGSSSTVRFVDNTTTSDLHGLTAGETYTISAWVYVPSSGGPDSEEVSLRLGDYTGAINITEVFLASGQEDRWVFVSVTHTWPSAATGSYAELRIASNAANAEYIYVDDIQLYRH